VNRSSPASRDPAVQPHLVVENAKEVLAIALSKSASANTILADLPPSSIVTFSVLASIANDAHAEFPAETCEVDFSRSQDVSQADVDPATGNL